MNMVTSVKAQQKQKLKKKKLTHTQILYGISIFYSDALYLLFLSLLSSLFLFLLLSFTIYMVNSLSTFIFIRLIFIECSTGIAATTTAAAADGSFNTQPKPWYSHLNAETNDACR